VLPVKSRSAHWFGLHAATVIRLLRFIDGWNNGWRVDRCIALLYSFPLCDAMFIRRPLN
jgi:hypothetical protein